MDTPNELRDPGPAPPAPVNVVRALDSADNGLATPGVALGIIGLSISWIPFLGFFAIPLGILETVFGGISFSKANRLGGFKKGQAIAGIVTGVLAILLCIAVVALFSVAAVSSIDG